MKKSRVLFLSIVSAVTIAVSGMSIARFFSKDLSLSSIGAHATTTECQYHSGYHYLEKHPTVNEPGHLEFWACCNCQHQYLEKPNGSFVDHDDSQMIGEIDQNHIAYLPPLQSGGFDGDYWTTDTFDDDFAPQAKTRIVVLAGQSNAAGVGYFDYLSQSVDASKINEIKNGYDNVLITGYSHEYLEGYHPVYANETSSTVGFTGTFGPEIGIADRLSKAFPDETIYLVKYAYGGSSLNYDWVSPNGRDVPIYVTNHLTDRDRGWLYDGLVECLSSVINDIYMTTDTIPSIEAFMWMQGESDAVFSGAMYNYLASFNTMMDDFKTTFAHNLSDDFALYDAEISESGLWQYATEINSMKNGRSDEYNIVLDTNARLTTQYEPVGETYDSAHYDAACYIDLGHMFADAYISKTLRVYEPNVLEITAPSSISMKYGQNYSMSAPTVKYNNSTVSAKLSYFAEQTTSNDSVISYFTVNGTTFIPTRKGSTNLRITAYYNNEVRTVVVPVTIF